MSSVPTAEYRRALKAPGIDLRNTLQQIGVYRVDPTHRSAPGAFAKAVLTPAGPGVMQLAWNSSGDVDAEAWGSGAEWLIDRVDRWVGTNDDLCGFDPAAHPKVERWWRDHSGLRLAALGVIWQELVLVLLGQRVTTEEAARSWNRICRTWGEPAPGPADLMLPPTPDVIAGLTYRELHQANVDRRRADAILVAARRANRLEEAAAMNVDDAYQRLTALPGLGAWTATATLVSSHGHPDVIVLRDYGQPTTVNYAFTGDAERLPPDEGGDEIMCAHLEPWRGHRQRIIRLLFAAKIQAPRRRPKAFNPDIRRL